jgi:hypothetical protein
MTKLWKSATAQLKPAAKRQIRPVSEIAGECIRDKIAASKKKESPW